MGRRKNKTNQTKHGISFEIAREILMTLLPCLFLIK
ncbi:BrnT family toxin [Campylobacter upsaliensis]|nr:BrnT family toxin [Campylobacter upsaliensis]EAI5623538.1 BrnT family toxin [Campylobacter upsaliensis]EAI9054133.1 BrnT family toxin [Campylobacter upsaliensis]EAI9058176.1 BrnT family toxin [Campylobacter upsaliensis]EAJ1462711.1 BrnT family toxin [Campylobacter upsaliensis]EAJ1632433.1 BrnT family toxin [Campylobacter upsaliensis]